MIAIVLRETTTLGVRFRTETRVELERAWVEVATPYGRVRVKTALRDGREVRAWPEYEDCAAAARNTGAALRDVQRAALAAHRARPGAGTRGRRRPRQRGGS